MILENLDKIFQTEELIVPNFSEIEFNDPSIRTAKKFLFDMILDYVNNKICEIDNKKYNSKTFKRLVKINYNQIKNATTNYNKELLQKTVAEIFSSNITSKYTSFSLDHNKTLIKNLLNDSDTIKKEKYKNLFGKTLLDFINCINEQKEIEGLEGFLDLYNGKAEEMKNNRKDKILDVIKDLKYIFYEKKIPRNSKKRKLK